MQDGRQLPNDIFKFIFVNENCCLLIQMSLQIVSRDWINMVYWFIYGSLGLNEFTNDIKNFAKGCNYLEDSRLSTTLIKWNVAFGSTDLNLNHFIEYICQRI